MEPLIQYAKTADGVSIAFWTLGEGTPLVHLPLSFSHIQLEWQIPQCRRWYERLAEKRKVVRLDPRGMGLSDRDIRELSADAWQLDVEAVVDRLGLEKFAVLGLHLTGPLAIAYAARHPGQVSRLILWCALARASDWWSARPAAESLRPIAGKDWEFYTEAAAHSVLGWSAGDLAHRYAALARESVTPEFFQTEVIPVLNGLDVTPLLPRVRSPTLVLHHRQYVLDVDVARSLASGIRDARLVLLEGESGAPYLGDMEAVLTAIDEFLGEGDEPAERPEPSGPGAFRTILFTDIESSTTLTQRLGDAKAQELLRTHNSIVRDALRAHSGSEVKHTGDGIMASFPSASRALQCAVAIQQAVAEWNADVGAALAPPQGAAGSAPTMPFRVRIGLNAGEPVAEEQDLFGTAVQLARRICDRAEPDQILVSNVVRELAAGKGFLFSDHGDVELRGFEDPVRLYEVRWRDND
jgi:class 3 adenylate cyclase